MQTLPQDYMVSVIAFRIIRADEMLSPLLTFVLALALLLRPAKAIKPTALLETARHIAKNG